MQDKKELLKVAKKALEKALTEGRPRATSEKTMFLENLKAEIVKLVEKGFSANQIHIILKNSGFLGSYQTVRTAISRWKQEADITNKQTKNDKKTNKEPVKNSSENKKLVAQTPKVETSTDKKNTYDTKLDF